MSGFFIPDGRNLDQLFGSGNAGFGTGFVANNGQDLGNRYMAGSIGMDTGYKLSDGRDLGYVFGNALEWPMNTYFEAHGAPQDVLYPGSGDGFQTVWVAPHTYCDGVLHNYSPGLYNSRYGGSCGAPHHLNGVGHWTWNVPFDNGTLAIPPFSWFKLRFWGSFDRSNNNFDITKYIQTDGNGYYFNRWNVLEGGWNELCDYWNVLSPATGATYYPVSCGQVCLSLNRKFFGVAFGYKVHPDIHGNCYVNVQRVAGIPGLVVAVDPLWNEYWWESYVDIRVSSGVPPYTLEAPFLSLAGNNPQAGIWYGYLDGGWSGQDYSTYFKVTDSAGQVWQHNFTYHDYD